MGAYEIGHPGIDGQHQRLFALANAVAESLVKSAEHKPGAAQLKALMDFALEHFEFEEDLMRSAGYPEAERHAKYHVSLLTELKTHCAKLDRGIPANPDSLIEYLWNWLLVHINTADRDLAVWLESRSVATP
jgi:hemerythrin